VPVGSDSSTDHFHFRGASSKHPKPAASRDARRSGASGA
jgi:hypothetical protein